MSKYIIDTDDFEPLFKVDSIGVFGIGKSLSDSDEDHSWSRIKSIEEFEELNSDYINEHFGDLQDTAYKKGLHDGESKCGYCNEYQRGLDDAWKATKKIFGYEIDGGIPIDEVGRVFGYSEDATFCTADIIRHNTAQEAIEKLKAYEEKQKADDKIEVGDEVRRKSASTNESSGIVTKDWGNSYFIMWTDGSSGQWDKDRVIKTGRHFDIASILEAMKND